MKKEKSLPEKIDYLLSEVFPTITKEQSDFISDILKWNDEMKAAFLLAKTIFEERISDEPKKKARSGEDKSCACLFWDGNAIYFNKEGEQIIDMQKHGWSGLHLFVKEFPNAPIAMTGSSEIGPYWVTNLLKLIEKPS